MGDLPPLVCCGWIPLDVVAVDVGANVVRGDVVGLFWSYAPWLCEPCLNFCSESAGAASGGFLLGWTCPWVDDCILADCPNY